MEIHCELSNEPKMNIVRCPLDSKGVLQNAKRSFSCKIALHLKKVRYKVSMNKYFSDKVARHSLAYLSVQKWFAGTSPAT